jgi:hypothetical protein
MPINDLSNKDIERGLWYLRNKKKIKKIFIIVLFVLIFCLYAFSLFKFITIKIADSRDTNQVWATINFNQSKPQDLIVISRDIVQNDIGGYDAVISVQNPNDRYFVSELKYRFVYSNGKSEDKSTFILPLETKRLIITNIKSESEINEINLEIINVSWKKLKSTEMGFPKDMFIFENQAVHFSESTTVLRNWIELDVTNQSPYNFKDVNFYLLVYSGTRLEAVKETSLSSFYSGDKKHIETSWFYKVPSYANLTVESDTNVFDKDNYISNK